MDDEALYDARIELIDFAIEVFHDAPTAAFVERLLSEEIRLPDEEVNEPIDEGFDHLRSAIESYEGRSPEAVADELTTTYTDLFVGPRPPVLAHETYYRDDTEFIGEGLATVQASYSASGWSSPDDYGEEDDFIAVELAFLRHLVERQRAGKREAVGFERVFLDEHLLEWYDDFRTDVHEATDEELYLAAADVFAGLVELEDEIAAQLST